MCVTSGQWDALCVGMEREDLAADPRFADGALRVEHGAELAAEIEEWTSRHTKHEAMQLLGAAGVPCSAILDTTELFTDPHLVARDFIQCIEHPTAGEVRVMRNPVRMSGSEVPIKAAPLLGGSTDEVLAADLGLSAEEIVALREAHVVV
jgi:formyl-CoA transferase